MPTYDFVCSCGEVTEARRGVDTPSIPCPACGGDAERAPFCAGVSIACDGLPTRAGVMAHERRYNVSEFQEAQNEVLYDQQRGKLPKRDLLKMGKRKAKALMAAGIKNVKDAPYASN